GQGLGGAIFAMKSTTNTNGNHQGMPSDLPVVQLGNVSFTSNSAANADGTAPADGVGEDQNNNDIFGTIGTFITEVTVPNDQTYGIGQELEFTVTFSEAVTITGAVSLPITLDTGGVVNATLVGDGSSSTTHTFRYTVNEGDEDTDGITVGTALVLPAGATIQNDDGFTASRTLNNIGDTTNILVDGVAPTLTSVAIASSNANSDLAKVGDTVTVTFTASEPLSELPAVTIGGQAATVTNTGDNDYSATYTLQAADTEGDLPINITFSDVAGNAGTAVTDTTDSSSVTFDRTPPTVTLTTEAADTVNAAFTVTATFSEDVTDFNASDITVANGIASNFEVVNATTYTFDITPTNEGDVTVDIAAGGATDSAGNSNLAATQLTRIYDITAPDAPTITSTGVTNNPTPDITGEAEAGSTVEVFKGGTSLGTTIADGDGNWTFTPDTDLAEGEFDFTATATDAAGNVSGTSNPVTLTIDIT
ncbi:Ig-like domain-containing protein, partial [Arthrospira platensis SPKY2]